MLDNGFWIAGMIALVAEWLMLVKDSCAGEQ